MVKYNPLPEGIPKGKAQGNSWRYIPLAPRKYWKAWFKYSIVKNDIMKNMLSATNVSFVTKCEMESIFLYTYLKV